MGEVWRAYDPVNDRPIALKVLPANYADDQVFKERFRREARAAAGLDEPHVVPIYDSGEIDGRLFVSMRLVGAATCKSCSERARYRRCVRSGLLNRSPQHCTPPMR